MGNTKGKAGWKASGQANSKKDRGYEASPSNVMRPRSSMGLSSQRDLVTDTELSVYHAAMKAFPTKEPALTRQKMICTSCHDGLSVYDDRNPREEAMVHKPSAADEDDRSRFKRSKARVRRKVSSKEDEEDPRVEIKRNQQAMMSALEKLNALTDFSQEDLSKNALEGREVEWRVDDVEKYSQTIVAREKLSKFACASAPNWPALDVEMNKTNEILSKCEVLDKALAEMAKNQARQVQQIAESKAEVETVDRQVQTVEENVSYSADVSTRATRLMNASRMNNVGLGHMIDLENCIGEEGYKAMKNEMKSSSKRGRDVMAQQMAKAIKELLAERKKMIQVMETLIASAREHAKRAQETEKKETENKFVQTEPISFSTKESASRQVDSEQVGGEVDAAADSTSKAIRQWKDYLSQFANKPKASVAPASILYRFLKEIVYEFTVHKFGLKSVADARLSDLLGSLPAYKDSMPLARIFGRLCGLLEEEYSQDALIFFCSAYDLLESTSMGGSSRSMTWFDLGTSTRAAELVAKITKLQEPPPNVKDPPPHRVPKREWERFKAVMASKAHSSSQADKVTVDLELWLDAILDKTFEFLESQETDLIRIFNENDANGDGILTFEEFLELVRNMSGSSTHGKELLDQCQSAYAAMLKQSADGRITPKIFAQTWRHHYHITVRTKTERRDDVSDEEPADEDKDKQDEKGGRAENWDKMDDMLEEALWDIEQFKQDHPQITEQNIFLLQLLEQAQNVRYSIHQRIGTEEEALQNIRELKRNKIKVDNYDVISCNPPHVDSR
ncbi:hypothetical protein GUITHDRAFT_113379 [Guillardia theta CCMP2712]|uniref:EF-hand domain-containing protein n=1 Tax=Guillardia theta (strain CCMP2712) TaxID=905079 RepID=L1IWE9_GUITC|nr:hypothetical protein GUITHDRAFT_113379 [Guillardia theta CCMP2712]EKX40593.1 hypothetical protein GUITHDRAFT_113379 [Guillardia theta CCMP2712]|eukprot:XP_005827573.1 hypothetical protein GUITHDRAFT_113379 [Guillardia theta CCMP2712]